MQSPVHRVDIFTALLLVLATQMLTLALKWTGLWEMSWTDTLMPTWLTAILFGSLYIAGKLWGRR